MPGPNSLCSSLLRSDMSAWNHRRITIGPNGFSLIELLVALAISGVTIAAIVTVFRYNTISYYTQEDIADMQQNTRVGKMFLERDIRMAGAGIKNFFDIGTRYYPIVFQNGAGTSETDILMITYVDFANSDCDNVLPQLTLAEKMPVSSAEAVVNEDLNDTSSPPYPPYSTWDGAFSCAGKTFGGTPFQEFKAIITSPDGSKSDLVYITQVQANSDKLQNRPYAGFDNKVINSYPAGSTIRFFDANQLVQITYSYAYNASTQRGSLLRNGDAIVENIEDLQFAFGLDTNNDNEIDLWVNDRDLDNTTSPPESEQVRLVRINLLGRTSSPHEGLSGIRPAIEDRQEAKTADLYPRKWLQVTVKTRNIR